jgi:hypothetical protein
MPGIWCITPDAAAVMGSAPGRAAGPGRLVRRVLLRQNIVIDAETAQLVAAAMQASLQAGAPSRPPRRGPHGPAADREPLS